MADGLWRAEGKAGAGQRAQQGGRGVKTLISSPRPPTTPPTIAPIGRDEEYSEGGGEGGEPGVEVWGGAPAVPAAPVTGGWLAGEGAGVAADAGCCVLAVSLVWTTSGAAVLAALGETPQVCELPACSERSMHHE